MSGRLFGELHGSPSLASEPLTLNEDRTEKLSGAYRVMWWVEKSESGSNEMEEKTSTGLFNTCSLGVTPE